MYYVKIAVILDRHDNNDSCWNVSDKEKVHESGQDAGNEEEVHGKQSGC